VGVDPTWSCFLLIKEDGCFWNKKLQPLPTLSFVKVGLLVLSWLAVQEHLFLSLTFALSVPLSPTWSSWESQLEQKKNPWCLGLSCLFSLLPKSTHDSPRAAGLFLVGLAILSPALLIRSNNSRFTQCNTDRIAFKDDFVPIAWLLQ